MLAVHIWILAFIESLTLQVFAFIDSFIWALWKVLKFEDMTNVSAVVGVLAMVSLLQRHYTKCKIREGVTFR